MQKPAPAAPGQKLSADQFAQSIKAKYPAYANVDNATLTQKMLAKYPEYANRVETGMPTQPAAPTDQPSGFWGNLANGVKAVGGAVISSEKAFGQDIAGAIQGSSAPDMTRSNQLDQQLIAKRKAQQKAGQSTVRTDAALLTKNQTPTNKQLNPVLGKSNTQILGDAAGVALDVATAGTFAKGAQSFKAVKAATKAVVPAAQVAGEATGLGSKLAQVGKQYLKSTGKLAATGYGYDVANNLKDGKTGTEAATPGLGTAVGAALPVLPALSKTAGAFGKASAPKIVNSLVKPLLKDFAYGKNPGRAIAEEGITGNNLEHLSQNISNRRGEIGKEIGSLSSRLDATADTAAEAGGRGRQVLQLEGSLKPIDEAMQTAAKTNNSTLLNRLQQVKEALTDNLTLGEADGAPTIVKGNPRNLDAANFAQAFDLKRQIGDMTQWTGNASDDKLVNGALKKIYGGVKEAINTTAANVDPQTAARLKVLNEKYADLTSAEVATKYRDKIDSRQNLVSLKAGVAGGTAALLAAPFTGGLSIPTVLIGLGAAGAEKALGSTAVKTRVAAWLAKESPSMIDKFYAQHPEVAQTVFKTFSKERKVVLPTAQEAQRGFVKLPGAKTPKIPKDDLATMSDFTDYHAGSYRPGKAEGQKLELDASRIWERHFPDRRMPKDNEGISNAFGAHLSKVNFGKGILPRKTTK